MNIHKNIEIINRLGSECIYCGQKATDKDHVISRNLFPDKSKGLSLITVPSCHSCNEGLSSDEEFFRLFIAGLSLDWSKKANTVFDTQVKRQLKRKPSLGWQQFNKMRVIDVKTPSGIYTGQKATAQYISEEDWERCFRVVEKTIKGLLYTMHNLKIEEKYEMRTTLGWDDTVKQFLPHLEYFEPAAYIDIFSFGYAMTADAPPVSAWFTQYYNRFTFCTWINKKGSFPKHKEPNKENRVLNLLT